MKRIASWIGLIGLCCTSLCMLGFPLLVSLLVALGLGKWANDRVMSIMVWMFLLMYGASAYDAFRHHRQWGPGALTLMGSGILAGMVLMVLPHRTGWIALAIFVGAWFWDRKLLKGCHR